MVLARYSSQIGPRPENISALLVCWWEREVFIELTGDERERKRDADGNAIQCNECNECNGGGGCE